MSDFSEHAYALWTRHLIDIHDFVVLGDDQIARFSGFSSQEFQVRPDDAEKVEPQVSPGSLGDMENPGARPVSPTGAVLLHIATLDECLEQPVKRRWRKLQLTL